MKRQERNRQFPNAVKSLVAEQRKNGVKMAEILRSVLFRKFTEAQVAKVFHCDPKTVQASKADLSKEGKAFRAEHGYRRHLPLRNYLKGDETVITNFFAYVEKTVGAPVHKKVVHVAKGVNAPKQGQAKKQGVKKQGARKDATATA